MWSWKLYEAEFHFLCINLAEIQPWISYLSVIHPCCPSECFYRWGTQISSKIRHQTAPLLMILLMHVALNAPILNHPLDLWNSWKNSSKFQIPTTIVEQKTLKKLHPGKINMEPQKSPNWKGTSSSKFFMLGFNIEKFSPWCFLHDHGVLFFPHIISGQVATVKLRLLWCTERWSSWRFSKSLGWRPLRWFFFVWRNWKWPQLVKWSVYI